MKKGVEEQIGQFPKLARYLLVGLVITFISFLYPNNVKFQYEFERGQTWRYEDLKAPFDFAIQKNEDIVEREINQLREQFPPVYEIHPEITRQQKAAFEQRFDQYLADINSGNQYRDVPRRPNVYRNFGLKFMSRVFDRGIIKLAPIHENKENSFVITIRHGNSTNRQTLQTIPKASDVRSWVTDSLFTSGLSEAEFLIPLLKDVFVPNLLYNDTLTKRLLDLELEGISRTSGMVRKGELIIPQNGIVTDELYQTLYSYQKAYEGQVSERKSFFGVLGGYFLLTCLIVGVFLLYLQYNARYIFSNFRRLVFMFLWIVAYSYLVYVVEGNLALSAYMIPFCIVPLVIRNFFNDELAIFTHVVVVLIASFLSSLGFEFTFLQMLAGIVAVLSTREIRVWSSFFLTIIFIFLAYGLGFVGLSLVRDGSVFNTDWSVFNWFFINTFLTLLAYPLIPLLERLFGFTSAITLVELSDMNQSLLKKLSLEAPGTLHHSLQVANLSEAAAVAIGADALLVKVAALYHDIGKINNPTYFIENQSGENPHDQLSPLDSAKVIIAHVTDGIVMAKKQKIPELLINFIRSHHGTTRVEYFYRQHLEANEDGEKDEAQFRYPGPSPSSKEETIMMIADSLEAASKSLKNPTGQDIDQLVDKITAGKISMGQLRESALSFGELELCKAAFKKTLRSINHVRVEYPEEKTQPEENN